MGRLNIILPEELERQLRNEAQKRFGLKRGNLTDAVKDAIKLWLTIEEETLNIAKYVMELENYELKRIDFDSSLNKEQKEIAKKEFRRKLHEEFPRFLFTTIQKALEDAKRIR
jgi:Arc/MetJ-type ribon-helix-helix transcriptional regulator